MLPPEEGGGDCGTKNCEGVFLGVPLWLRRTASFPADETALLATKTLWGEGEPPGIELMPELENEGEDEGAIWAAEGELLMAADLKAVPVDADWLPLPTDLGICEDLFLLPPS